ncbi:MAG TPA: hypothetical protein VF598_00855 [Hymenobacter sp.]
MPCWRFNCIIWYGPQPAANGHTLQPTYHCCHRPAMLPRGRGHEGAGRPAGLHGPARGVAQRQVALVGPARRVAAHELLPVGHAVGRRQAQRLHGPAAAGFQEHDVGRLAFVRVDGPGRQHVAGGHVQHQPHRAVAHLRAHPAPQLRGLFHFEVAVRHGEYVAGNV